MPPVENHRNHVVLYQLPWQANSAEPPVPHSGQLKWDPDHVRLPSSNRNEYTVKEDVC